MLLFFHRLRIIDPLNWDKIYHSFFHVFKQILFCLCYYSCPDFFPHIRPPPGTPTSSGNPHVIVHVHEHGSCVSVFWLLHFLYCTLHPHGYSVTTYLHVLIPSPIIPLPSGKPEKVLLTHESVSVLFLCLVF